MKRYNPADIEPKWQAEWQRNQTYRAHDDSPKPPYYALSFFPYPSGIGLHLGHVRNFSITDTVARYKRMTGHEVLHPVGWDSFGLPAENFAIKTGQAPQVTTKQNTDNFRRQMQRLGFSIDWEREFGSTDPDYYRWTQWFFLLLHKRGLAYQKESAQFWCPKCKTVLANEQVVGGGFCWRHEDTPVEKKLLKQWFFKITDYADRLEADLEAIDWPEGIKAMQRNWIGRSKGAEIQFAIHRHKQQLSVFTTRPDTLYGVSFMVLAPEHPLVPSITTAKHKAEVEAYIAQSQTKTEIDRMEQNREKTGVFTGAHAINPANGDKIPIWIADYVLMGYGTGAIMAVPAHDERDYAFARKFDLPIIEVVEPETGIPQAEPEFRRSIVALVRRPGTNEYLSLDWGKHGGHLFIGGGLEGDEDPVEAARREIAEETGYTKVELVAQTGTIHHNYFAHSKNVARRIEARALLFDLVDESRSEPALEADERNKFSLQWLTAAEAEAKIRDELHATSYRLLAKGECFHGEGIITNSGPYNGLASAIARDKIVADLSQQKVARERVNYKLRDWLISRQRYWGAPIPMIHCAKCGTQPVPEDQLPVTLPELADFEPSGDGRSPLAKVRDWVEVDCPQCGGRAERETDTMDGFACSSWYFLRFADPKNNQAAFDRQLAERWAPVDMYVGGAEHAVMHLLYARMWTKVMADEGLISFDEPFTALRNQGMLQAADGSKFSKSAGNDIKPEEIIEQGYGADALRLIVMFLAPFDQSVPWSPKGLAGCYRFLQRSWSLCQTYHAVTPVAEPTAHADLRHARHTVVKRVTRDMQQLGFNTAIAAMMEYVNQLHKLQRSAPMAQHYADWNDALSCLVQLLAPFAPHISEELWQQLGGEGSVHLSNWPHYDEAVLATDTMTVVVQVNGRLRAQLELPRAADQPAVVAAAMADEHVQEFLQGQTPRKTIYVPGRLVNFVVGG